MPVGRGGAERETQRETDRQRVCANQPEQTRQEERAGDRDRDWGRDWQVGDSEIRNRGNWRGSIELSPEFTNIPFLFGLNERRLLQWPVSMNEQPRQPLTNLCEWMAAFPPCLYKGNNQLKQAVQNHNENGFRGTAIAPVYWQRFQRHTKFWMMNRCSKFLRIM